MLCTRLRSVCVVCGGHHPCFFRRRRRRPRSTLFPYTTLFRSSRSARYWKSPRCPSGSNFLPELLSNERQSSLLHCSHHIPSTAFCYWLTHTLQQPSAARL